MFELNYLSFDLWIGRTEEGHIVRGWDSHGREATTDLRIPFGELEIQDFWRRIGLPHSRARRHAAAPGAGDRSRRVDLLQQSEMPKSFGGSLFEALFHDDRLRSCFRDSLEEARRKRAGLRIRLRLADVPDLTDLPWEYLYDSNSDRFFALSMKTPVVRYLELPERLQPLTVRPPLKMLVMIAGPSDYAELDAEQEWRRLNEALGAYQQRNLIHLERLEGATLPALQHRLRRGGAHVFHFIGHGEFDQRSQKGALILEDASGRGLSVSAEDLGIVLHDHALRLVVLNACEGARTSRLNPFAGVAQTLVRQGVPAVIAMQTEVLDDFALTMAHEFYGALADDLPVDACLAEARKFLAGQQRTEWGAPVLYLRAPDGRILDLEDSQEGDLVGEAAGNGGTIPDPSGPAAPLLINIEQGGEGREVVSERASPTTMSRLTWKEVAAALALIVFVLVAYDRWRESSTGDNQPLAEPQLSEAEPPRESATGPVAPTAAGDHIAEDRETKPSKPMVGGSDRPIERSPGPEEPAFADGSGLDAKRPALSELRTAQVVPSWPRGDSRQNLRRNERDGQYYVWIPEGSFRFGCSLGDDLCEDDEKPFADQRIEHGFWLGRTEVTVGAYKRFRDHPSKLPPAPSFNADWLNEVQPMVNVSRAEAGKFCAWAATRLPTEIEWEYAARAGERRALPPDVSDKAWFADQSGGGAHAVSQKEPNAFGLYDMLGNASEWLAPRPDEPVDSGVLRGGSWNHPEQFLRFSFRLPAAPNERDEMFGFRCLADPAF